MTRIAWDSKARDVLRKLPARTARRIVQKIDREVQGNVTRYLEPLVNREGHKIRVGDYRLFVDYHQGSDHLTIRAIRHRGQAYKT